MTYISWFIGIGLYLEDSVMYKGMTLAGGIHEPLLTYSSFNCQRVWKTCVKCQGKIREKSGNFEVDDK